MTVILSLGSLDRPNIWLSGKYFSFLLYDLYIFFRKRSFVFLLHVNYFTTFYYQPFKVYFFSFNITYKRFYFLNIHKVFNFIEIKISNVVMLETIQSSLHLTNLLKYFMLIHKYYDTCIKRSKISMLINIYI